MRRGADVTRTDTLTTPAPGMGWIAKFAYRGRDRTVSIRLDTLDPSTALAFSGLSAVADAQVKVELLGLAAKRTRLLIDIDLTPKTFGARLYLQSLKLARVRVERNFGQRVAQLTAEIDDRYRSSVR